jgi:hypothetical protein
MMISHATSDLVLIGNLQSTGAGTLTQQHAGLNRNRSPKSRITINARGFFFALTQDEHGHLGRFISPYTIKHLTADKRRLFMTRDPT